MKRLLLSSAAALLFVLLAAGCGRQAATAPIVAPAVARASAFTPGVSTVWDVIRAGGVAVKTYPDGTKLYRLPNGAPSVVVGPITVVCIADCGNLMGPCAPGHCRDDGSP